MPRANVALGTNECRPPACFDLLACLGEVCMPWPQLRERIAVARGGWRAALVETAFNANATLKGDRFRNCVRCDASALERSDEYPFEVWNVSGGIDHLQAIPREALYPVASAGNVQILGDVPELLSAPGQSLNFKNFRKYPPKHKMPVVFPCSSSRGEDAGVLHTFFTDRETRAPLRDGTFLEIGGANGLTDSNSWIYEVCLGWQGVLVEGHPRFFAQMRRHRPRSLNLRMAACSSASGWVNYTASRDTFAGVVSQFEGASSRRVVRVGCGNLGARLQSLGVYRLDFASIDVEGSEQMVVTSLDVPGLSLGVLLIEVRADGQRPALLQHLLARGMRYVGQVTARGTSVNKVVDDCFVNITHLRRYFPRSWALDGLPPAWGVL